MLLCVGVLAWPKKSPVRTLVPEALTSAPVSWSTVTPQSQVPLLLKASFSQAMGPSPVEVLQKSPADKPSRRIAELRVHQPNLFPRALRFRFLSAQCPSSLRLERQGISGSLLSCTPVEESEANVVEALYRLSDISNPGLETLSFSSASAPSTSWNFLVHANEHATSPWVQGGGDTVAPWHWLVRVRERGWYFAVTYFLVALLSVGSLTALASSSRTKWVLPSFISSRQPIVPALFAVVFVAVHALAVFSLQPLFAGNDETAHASMAVDVALSKASLEGDARNAALHEAYAKIRHSMYAADFFQMHNVLPLPERTCPHFILSAQQGDCGHSAKPQAFYSDYLSFLSPLALPIQRFLVLVRMQNLLVFAFLLSAAVAFVALGVRAAGLLVALAFVGAAFTSLNSLTNDVASLVCGLLLSVLQFALFQTHVKKIRLFMATAVTGGLVFALRGADVSMVPVFAGYLVTVFLLCVRLFAKPFVSLPEERLSWARASLFVASFFFLAVVLHIVALSFLRSTIPQVVSRALAWKPELAYEANLLLPFADTTLVQMGHWSWEVVKSALGRYVWSHSTFPEPVLSLTVAGLAALAICGAAQMFWKRGFLPKALMLVFTLQSLGFVVLVSAIAKGHEQNSFGQWTFLVFRFYTGFLPVFLVPLGLLFQKVLLSEKKGVRVLWLCAAWLLLCHFHFYPQIFVVDAF